MLPEKWMIVGERANHAVLELGRYMSRVSDFVRHESNVWQAPADSDCSNSLECYEVLATDGQRLRNLFIEAFSVLDVEIEADYPLMIVSACYQLAYVTDPAVTLPTYADLVGLTDIGRIHTYVGHMQQIALVRTHQAIERQAAQN